MSLGWDEEAPTGFQEADLELRELEDQLDEVEEREPYMTAAELRFEAELDEMALYESRFEDDGPYGDDYI